MITPEGLKDQLLGLVVAFERADLEEKKNQLVIQSAENASKLNDCENQILKVGTQASGIVSPALCCCTQCPQCACWMLACLCHEQERKVIVPYSSSQSCHEVMRGERID